MSSPLDWYLGVNAVTFAVYGYDKWQAKTGGWRVSEFSLFLLGMGGPFGAIAGMFLCGHKTSKLRFWMWNMGLAWLHVKVLQDLDIEAIAAH